MSLYRGKKRGFLLLEGGAQDLAVSIASGGKGGGGKRKGGGASCVYRGGEPMFPRQKTAAVVLRCGKRSWGGGGALDLKRDVSFLQGGGALGFAVGGKKGGGSLDEALRGGGEKRCSDQKSRYHFFVERKKETIH